MEHFLTNAFLYTLRAGYPAGIAVLFLLIARFLFDRLHLPKKYACILWTLPFARLLPAAWPQSGFSLLPKHSAASPVLVTMTGQAPARSDGQALLPSVGQTVSNAARSADGNFAQDPVFALSLLWAAGVAALFLYGAVSILYLKWKLRASVLAEGCSVNSSPEGGRHKNSRIYLADHLKSPFVMGLFRPSVYLPSDLPEHVREYVIRHELAHIRRKDPILKLLMFSLTAVHWHNPLIWAAYALCCRDMEYACDEAAVRLENEGYRKAYASALLSLSIQKTGNARMFPSFSKGSPKQRIQHIIAHQKPLAQAGILGALLIALLGVGLLTNPKERGGQQAGSPDRASGVAHQPDETEAPSRLTAKAPSIDLSATVGADGVRLYYGDGTTLVFGGYFGLLWYSIPERRVLGGLDVGAIGCGRTQGGDACEICVSEDGTTAYLHPAGSHEMYVYSIAENTLEQKPFDLSGIPLFTDCADGQTVSDGEGGVYGGIVFADTIGSISWYGFDKRENGLLTFERCFPPPGYENAVDFAPGDIYDLKAASMFIDGQIRTVRDEAALSWLEENLSTASHVQGGTACPFLDPMYLTRTDGVIGIIYPATDSCSMFQASGGQYAYGQGENDVFWDWFKDWKKRL